MALMYRVRTVLTYGQGGPGLSTAYFVVSGATNSTDALAAVNRVRGCWDVFKSSLATSMTAQTSGAVDFVEAATGALTGGLSVTTPAVVTGTSAAGQAPAQLQSGLIILTNTIINNRKIKGRINLGPLHAGNAGFLVPPASLNTNIDAFGVALYASGAIPALAVWARPHTATVEKPTPPTRVGTAVPSVGTTHSGKFWSSRSRRD